MPEDPIRVLFMGTPSFVVPVLAGLAASPNLEVVAVYTQPDRPRGRGRRTEMPPVKAKAAELGLPVRQPASLRQDDVQVELAAFKPDVLVIAAYGKLLPAAVLETPAHGCLNLHPSLLPRYRGPSPVTTAIADGEKTTGITLMLLDQGMDSGPIIAQQEFPLTGRETGESLTGELFELGAEMLLKGLPDWVAGLLSASPQDDESATVTRKLERDHGEADWQLPAALLERRSRAYTPWPGLFTRWQGKVLKLNQVSLPSSSPEIAETPGRVIALRDGDTPIAVVTGDGVLGLNTLQLEGRRPQSAQEFLRGHPDFAGAQL